LPATASFTHTLLNMPRHHLTRTMNKRNRSNNNNDRNPKYNVGTLPPLETTTVIKSRTVRFLTAGLVSNYGVTNANLLTNWCLATSTTACSSIIASVKLKRIQMWYANESASSPQSLIIEGAPQSGSGNPYVGSLSDLHIVTALGASSQAYLDYRPAKNSSAAMWLSNNSSQIYTVVNLSCPQGTIIDVTYDCALIDDEPSLVGPTLVSATVGKLYTLSLDHSGGGLIVPIGLNAI